MSTEVKEKIRKVFLEHLPVSEGIGKNKNKMVISWNLSIGYKVKGVYEGIEFEVEIVDYKDRYLYIKYLDKPVFKILSENFKRGKLGNLMDKITTNFKVEIGEIFKDEKRHMVIIDREYRVVTHGDGVTSNEKWYKYYCNKCEHEGYIIETLLLNRRMGCQCNSIVDTTPWMIPYFQGGYDEAKLYTYGSGKYIYPICPDCGRIRAKPIQIKVIYVEHSIGCSCSDKISYPNKFGRSLLNQLNKIYKFDYLEHEYSPEWIGKRSYDNYFIHNGQGYILEMDGGWHTIDNNLSGQTKEKSRQIDDYKDRLAKEHNIEVIRINCDESKLEFIKNSMLSSDLNKLFDLNKINWLKCDEFALSNLVKLACDYKRNNSKITPREIGKIMKLDESTIRDYLKRGKIQGWCEYIPRYKKKVEISKEGISLGIFPSVSELVRNSEELFGVKLNAGAISLICLGKRNRHKGYTFQYIN